MDRTAEIRKVLLITLLLNLAVSGTKIAYGYFIRSVAVTSDGFHSLFDGVSNVAGLIGTRIASHPPDEQHPYGHRKYETVFAIFVGVLMFITCFEIFRDSYHSLQGIRRPAVTMGSFIVMLATLLVNTFVTRYEARVGKRLNSEFLIADSRHTRSDIYVTFGVIVGLIFIRLDFPLADPIAGIIVGVLIARAGMQIIKESTETLVDRTQADTALIEQVACSVQGVAECHDIRTRGTRDQVFIDLHVLVNPFLSVEDSHRIADQVEEEIKTRFPEIKDVVVHIEPSKQR
ncbi:MAG: cation diffusion facilitator family transporter [Nitrospirota bacterium]